MARIVFLGTPEYGAIILRALIEAQHHVVAVVTQPDCLAGRGRRLVQVSPVKRVALDHDIPVLQPVVLRRDRRVTDALHSLSPDVLVLAAYGQILRGPVLRLAPGGCIGVHASLLPRHRGAAPVAAAIMAGDRETGVTLMLTDAGIDTGPVIARARVPISSQDTTGTLTIRLAELGASLLVQALPAWLAGELKPEPQDDSLATYAPEIRSEDGGIDWHRSAEEIDRLIRAMQPWPGAFCGCGAARLKIISADPKTDWQGRGEPGEVVRVGRQIGVITGRGLLLLHQVQIEGRRVMSADEFARGRNDMLKMVLACAQPACSDGA